MNALDAVGDFRRRLLRFDAGAEAVLPAAQEYPGESLLQLYAAALHLVEPHVEECYQPFLSAHHVYALARSGRALAADRIVSVTRAQTDSVWRTAGAQAVAAAREFGRGEYSAAAELFDPVADRLTTLGGSDAQDDLFRQMYLVALARSGRTADAGFWLQAMGGADTPLQNHFRAEL